MYIYIIDYWPGYALSYYQHSEGVIVAVAGSVEELEIMLRNEIRSDYKDYDVHLNMALKEMICFELFGHDYETGIIKKSLF